MALGGVGTTVSHVHELDSSNGVVVSEGGVVFFGALQNPCPNILVLDVLEVLDAMAPPMLEELAVLEELALAASVAASIASNIRSGIILSAGGQTNAARRYAQLR